MLANPIYVGKEKPSSVTIGSQHLNFASDITSDITSDMETQFRQRKFILMDDDLDIATIKRRMDKLAEEEEQEPELEKVEEQPLMASK